MSPSVMLIVFVAIVNVFPSRVKEPFIKSKLPVTVKSPSKLIPFERFNSKLLVTKLGILVLAPFPPIIILLELPPTKVPKVVVTLPFIVKVFAPIEKAPLVSVN